MSHLHRLRCDGIHYGQLHCKTNLFYTTLVCLCKSQQNSRHKVSIRFDSYKFIDSSAFALALLFIDLIMTCLFCYTITIHKVFRLRQEYLSELTQSRAHSRIIRK